MSLSLNPRHPTVRPLEPIDYEPIRLFMEVEWPDEAPGPLRGMRVGCSEKEPWTVAFIESIPAGGVYYDVGANVGGYALIAAARGIVTVAFEPVPSNYDVLVRNAMWNGLEERIIPIAQGLAARPAIVWCNLVDLRPGAASHEWGDLPSIKRPGVGRHRIPLMVNALDNLLGMYPLPPPTHIKIDVDGWEQEVLAGMTQVLAGETLQGIMIELQREHEAAITAQLAAAGWELADRWDPPGREIAYGSYRRVGAVMVPVAKKRVRNRKKAAA